MAKEEELCQAQLEVDEEEEARKRESARQKPFDLKAWFCRLDELRTKANLYSEFLLEKDGPSATEYVRCSHWWFCLLVQHEVV